MIGKKVMALLCLTGMLGGALAGCGSSSAPEERTASDSAVAEIQGTDMSASQDMPQGTTASQSGDQNASQDEGTGSEGRWQVLDPRTAAVVDADFLGMVWKLDTDAFYIVEEEVEILEDGSILGGSPSPDAEIPDSELIRVVFDENTYFYIRNIEDGGKSYEDAEAGFQDIEEYVSVDMKGQFEDDVFYAREVRINRIL